MSEKTKIVVAFRNTETLEIEVDNPHVEWFVVHVNGKARVYTFSHNFGEETGRGKK